MQVTIIEFSPTGGTHKVAAALAQALGEARATIDLCNRKLAFDALEVNAESIAVVAAPAFAGRVPELAAERLKAINGNGAKAVVVAVYGGRAFEDTMVELADLCAAANMQVIAGVAGLAQHSILPQYATDRPNELDVEALQAIAQQIAEHLATGNASAPMLPGNRPYKKAGGAILVPKTSSACTQCKLCAQNCPAGAIDMSDCTKTDKNLCIGCMRCLRECPDQARSVSSVMTAVAAKAIKKECSVPKSVELFIS